MRLLANTTLFNSPIASTNECFKANTKFIQRRSVFGHRTGNNPLGACLHRSCNITGRPHAAAHEERKSLNGCGFGDQVGMDRCIRATPRFQVEQ